MYLNKPKKKKRAENRRLVVNELTERLRNKYYGVEERGGAEQAEASLNLIINDPNDFDKFFDRNYIFLKLHVSIFNQ